MQQDKSLRTNNSGVGGGWNIRHIAASIHCILLYFILFIDAVVCNCHCLLCIVLSEGVDATK